LTRNAFAAKLGIGVQNGPVYIADLPPPDAVIAAEWLGVSHVIPDALRAR
jgi:hypothetical protein